MKLRLIVRRTRLVGPQTPLWPDWRYHTFATNLDQPPTEANQHRHPNTGTDHSSTPMVEADRYHRAHAVCELAIRDLKGSAGLSHLPSGRFAAWLACTALTHNIYRWIALLGRTQPPGQLVSGPTIRTRLFGLPGRVVNHSGQHTLRLPAQWP